MRLPEYESFAEKDSFYQMERVKTVKEFQKIYDSLKQESSHLIFRGVREAKFKNYTSAQREWLTKDLSNQIKYFDFIEHVLRNIKNNECLKEYYKALGVIPNDLLYLSFLQHYGSPTPMLDFSHDLDSALFFAFDKVEENKTINEIEDYVSVYYIDLEECGKELVDMIALYDGSISSVVEMVEDFKKDNPDAKIDDSLIRNISEYVKWGTEGGFSEVNLGLYDGIFTNKTVTLPTGQKLVWANLNLIAQKGCFINYNLANDPLEVYLAQYQYLPKLHCVDIPKAFEKYITKVIGKTKDDIYPQEETIAKNSFDDYLTTFE